VCIAALLLLKQLRTVINTCQIGEFSPIIEKGKIELETFLAKGLVSGFEGKSTMNVRRSELSIE
jgi:hypothetical protein